MAEGLRRCGEGSWDWEVLLDRLVGPNFITRALIKWGVERVRVREGKVITKAGGELCPWKQELE